MESWISKLRYHPLYPVLVVVIAVVYFIADHILKAEAGEFEEPSEKAF